MRIACVYRHEHDHHQQYKRNKFIIHAKCAVGTVD